MAVLPFAPRKLRAWSRARPFQLLFAVVCALPLALVPAGAAVGSSPDHPSSVVWSPVAGSLVTVGMPVTISGGAVNGEIGGVISVEVSLDGGSTWHLAYPDGISGWGKWSFQFTPTEPGVVTIVSRAATPNVVEVPDRSYTIKVASDAGGPCPCFMQWPSRPGTGPSEDPDGQAVELGLRFQTDRDGFVAGVLFYRHSHWWELGLPFVGHLWSAAGDLLATQTITSTGDDFPYIRFDQPVPVQAGQTYVVSYYTPYGHYASTENYFDSPVTAPPFTTVVDAAGGSGVYTYSEGGGFPDQTWHASNYWVEPVFTTS